MEYMKKARAKGMTIRTMEGDVAADILTYLPTGEVAKTVFVVRAWYRKAREMQNNLK